jgi:hypothetical protein
LPPRCAKPNPPQPLPSGPFGVRIGACGCSCCCSSRGVVLLPGEEYSACRLCGTGSGLGVQFGSNSSRPEPEVFCILRGASNPRLSGWRFSSWRASLFLYPPLPRPRPRPVYPSALGGVTAPGDDVPDDGFDSPKILALASSYRRCFSSLSRFCFARISSGLNGTSFLGSLSSSSESPDMPAAAPRLAMTGFRLSTLT